MSLNRSIGGIDEEDQYYFKVFKVMRCEARAVLYYIFNKGCPRDLSKSFEIHARKVLKMSNRTFKKCFDDTMGKKMKENPSGNAFDVSLLNACIRSTCPAISESDKDTFIKPIKEHRNDVTHNIEIKDETSMNNEIQKLRNMLVNALKKAKEVYNLPQTEVNDMIDLMDANIQQIKEAPLPPTDIAMYKTMVVEFRKAKESLVQNKGVKSLKVNYKDLTNVDPASWISGKERLNVKMVYTRLDIILKSKDVDFCHGVGHEDLLQLKTEEGIRPMIIVVEGDAGAGKSTLAKFILADWADLNVTGSSSSIKGLQEFDLVLYVECKNKDISSFLDLLQTLMPQVSYEMTDRDLERSVLAKKTLVVVDGLDEMTVNSEMLLKEMLGTCMQKSDDKLQFIITTRPQRMSSVRKLCKNHPKVHVKITGIPPERRVEFVEKLHEEMIKEGQSQQNTSLLVDYVRHSQCRLGDHYRLPLNLTLLTYLWANNPEIINSVTSATGLYIALLDLLKLRVIDRIQDAFGSSAGVEDFLKVLFEVYLTTHRSQSIQVSENCQKRLETECEKLGLPFLDMCGAFFSVDNQWTCSGPQIYLSSPHKSIMEFFGAYRIYDCLANTDREDATKELEALRNKYPHLIPECEVKGEPQTLTDILSSLLSEDENLESIDLPHYQNVFIHLGGLMALKKMEVLHQYGEELVEVLQDSEMTETQWLDLVAEAECDPIFTSLIAQQISEKLVIRDGHTGAALEIFKKLDSRLPVQVILQTEVKYIPMIDDLMKKLSERDCTVELLLNNHWKNPKNGMSTEHLKKLFDKAICSVIRFTGNLDNLEVLPDSVEKVRLTIADDEQAKKICKDIALLDKTLPLEYLGVHVMKGVSPSLLEPLPVVTPTKEESGTIWLSGVSDTDVDNTFEIIKALFPLNKKFQSIMFPRCRLTLSGFEDLLTKLKAAGVRVSKFIKTDSLNLDAKELSKLRDLTKEDFGCEFSRGDESSVW